MTVWYIRDDGVIDVHWFIGRVLQRDAFHADELTIQEDYHG